ncbi:MAG: methylenetetrahydrofolate dehydrogenase (NADP+) / methenyltetrahydrofolate cyclohydrolase [Parcubacteria group bacterium Gr01-1014_56]|nr:MAG: methylenetetrahydrofolate dehydrogenase (NADP+) / methenyltetrahydrofolate cyclohydrolase [Parcubacteria group bacterium Gr01-1014_56]
MIIDGKKIANEILDGLHGTYTLGIVMGSDTTSNSFVRMKERAAARVGVVVKRFSAEEFDQALVCDGVIVQLPIADAEALLAKIPPQKDVDALGKSPLVHAPVAEAVKEVLTRAGVAVKNKKAVVVGTGRLVGMPCAELLREMGADVSVVTLLQGSLGELKNAEIVVLGAGSPGLIKPEMLKPGVVLIDAGTSEQSGKVVGDADPACAEVASVFTPVPGGIGPIAVAMIFKNLFVLAAEKKRGKGTLMPL